MVVDVFAGLVLEVVLGMALPADVGVVGSWW